jgi:hypothetical protein
VLDVLDHPVIQRPEGVTAISFGLNLTQNGDW